MAPPPVHVPGVGKETLAACWSPAKVLLGGWGVAAGGPWGVLLSTVRGLPWAWWPSR